MALASAVVVAPASGAPRCAVPGRVVTTPDGWTKIAPDFGSGAEAIKDYDVFPMSADRLVVTNGSSLVFTNNRGCTWTPSKVPDTLALPTLPTGGEPNRIVSNGISQVRFAHGFLPIAYALGQTELGAEGGPVVQPRVLRSVDGANTFEDFTDGLPDFGRPVAIRADESIAVLLFHETAPLDAWTIYTNTGGAWEERWTDLKPMSDLTVDFEYESNDVWVWNGSGVFRSNLVNDAPLEPVPGVSGNVKAVDVSRDKDDRPATSVFFASGDERMVSIDDGPFQPKPAPEGVESVAHNARPGLLAISSVETNVLIENPVRADADFSPAGANVSSLRFAGLTGGGFPLYAKNPNNLFFRIVPPDFEPPPTPPIPVDVEVEEPSITRPVPLIKPVGEVVTLDPDKTKTIDYTVKLPPVPTPLDVYFMTDSTGSMGGAIASVQESVQDIVNALAARGVDLNFGVADFRDYPETPADGASTYPYKQRRKIGPIDSDLEDALQGIATGGGTTDGHDAALEATRQALTGAGSTSLTGQQLIPQGFGAGWREGAMKVILVASDDDMRKGGITNPAYPGPSLEEVVGLLKEHDDVEYVGIEVDTDSGNPRVDMEKLALAAGTLAPPEGVDCDDDGEPDIAFGKPIVCTFSPGTGGSIAPAFISMLNGIKDFATIDVEVDGPDDVVRPLAQTSFPGIDVKKPSAFTVPVEFSCAADQAGTETPVEVTVTSRGREIISTGATVRCIAPAKPVKPKVVPPPVVEELVPPPAPPRVVAVAVVPPAPPPAPVSNAQPNPNPNPNPNPQLNPNAGMASQEDHQHQLALAELDVHNTMESEELAFSALEVEGPVYPALAWTAAAGMTLAAGYALHLARRTAPAPARAFNPRDHR